MPSPTTTPVTTIGSVSASGQFGVVEKAELNRPKLGSALDDLVTRLEAGVLSPEEAAREAPLHLGESVAVTIDLSGSVEDVVSFLEDNGGSTIVVGGTYIEALVPVGLLVEIAEQPGVTRVRVIQPPQSNQSAPETIVGNGPAVHGSTAWNEAGYRGQGVKVGIIDNGFDGFGDLMGTELPQTVVARCYRLGTPPSDDLDDCEREIASGWERDAHGTAVAEAVVDIAPDVSLYIARPFSKATLQDAARWMISEGVMVINHSVAWDFDGPGDGTSPREDSPLNTVDRSVASGAVWVNAAGNDALDTWFRRNPSYSTKTVGEEEIRFIEFYESADRGPIIGVGFDAAGLLQLRWEDSWDPEGGAASDLAIYIMEEPEDNRDLTEISNPQEGERGQIPYEEFEGEGIDVVLVAILSGEEPEWVQLVSWGGIGLPPEVSGPGSITNPAESANPGMLTVGAAHWEYVDTIEDFSSRGPTPDGRIKPDLVGADCGKSAADSEFCGTSQASPHVAGLAALVRQRFPDYTPAEVVSYLKENAEQRISSPDPNNTWGHGFVVLPPITTDVASISDLVVDAPTVDTSAPAAGTSFTLNATVRNQGSGPADSTTLRYYQSADSTITTGDTEVGTNPVSSLDASESGDESITLDAPPTPGNYYYGACVDAVSDETDTTNNCSPAVTVTVGAAPAPDLVWDRPTVNNSNPDVGASFTLQFTVRNQGNGSSALLTLRYYQSNDPTITTEDTEVATDSVTGLDPGGTTTRSVSPGPLSASGTYYYGACVDAVSDETDTTNNCSPAVTVTVGAAPAPDLVWDRPTVNNSNPDVGASFTLQFTVRNQGNGSSALLTLRYYQSNDPTITTGDTEVATDSVTGLDPGGTTTRSVSPGPLSASGTYYYGACVDAVSDETDTTNNCSPAVTVTVGAAPAPDLVVNVPTVSESAPAAGATLTLSATVRNQGNGASNSTTLRYYQSSDSTITTGDTGVGTDSVSRLDASGSGDESVSLDAPSTPGTYYYGACVDAVTGESDTTNNCSAAVTVTVGAAPAPDLEVNVPTVSESAPAAGARFTLNATVQNQGNGSSAFTTLRYYQSTDSTITTVDTEIDTDSVSSLDAAESGDESISLTAPSTPGTYYYGACVDAVSDESDTSNNCSPAVTVTVGAAPAPDLVVEAPTVSESAPAAGARFTLSSTVRNQGSGSSAFTTLRYYQSNDSTITTGDTEVGSDSVSSLDAAESGDESISLTAPSTPGTYYYGACVDAVSDESDTTNNCSPAVTVTVGAAPAPDLVVEAPTVSESAPAAGARFTLSATVRNQGSGSSAFTTLGYYQSNDSTITTGDTEVSTDSVSSLDAAESGDESISLTAPSSAGTYYYGACVDAVSDESDTTNNCSTAVAVTVGAAPAPDLVVDTPTVSESAPAAGARFTLSATVRNQGNGSSAFTTLRYYQSTDPTITTGDTEVGTDSVSSLDAAESGDESISLTAPSSAGTYYYGACVDAVSDESDTQNNCSLTVTVTVGAAPAPDLVVDAPAVDTSVPAAGARITLSATVRNQGSSSADSSTLRYYQSTDSTINTGDTEVGTDSVSGLDASQSGDESISLNAPSDPGTYYYGACVDAVSDESDTQNNCSLAVAVTVGAAPAPDLVVDTPTVDTNAPVAGASFTLNARVRNQGNSSSSSTTLRYYQSSDSTITTGDTEVGTDSVFRLDASENGDESVTLTAPSIVGTYYYGACVEVVSGESDTTNNCSAGVQVTVGAAPAPDLMVDTPTVSESAPAAGARITLSATVRNQGNGRSDSTTLRYYQSSDSTITTGDTEVGTDSVFRLDASESGDESVSLTAPDSPGTYYLGACVDTVPDESDTTNNCSAGVQVTVGAAPAPDLMVDTPTVSESAPAAGARITLSATVRNQGNGRSDSTTLRYYQSADSTITTGDTEVGTDSVSGLDASQSGDESISLAAPDAPGIYYYGACAEAVSDESDATNNCSAAVTVTVRAAPDNPANQRFSWQASTIVVSWDQVAGAEYYNIYYDDFFDSSCRLAFGRPNLCEELAANVVGTSYTHTDPDADANYYWITACNNTGCSDIDSSNPARLEGSAPAPDLVVEAPTVSESAPAAGARFTLSATVRNQGSGSSAFTTLRYYQSTDSTITTSDTEVGTDSVSRLDASESGDESISLDAPSAPGTYYYGTCVDSVSDESDTTNNCSLSVAVTVGAAPAPDLVVDTPMVSESAPAAGTSFTLNATVRNQGNGASVSTTLRYYQSTDSTITTSDTEVGTDSVSRLDASESGDESISLDAPSAPGTYYYGACVDAVSDESDTTNNCSLSVAVTVGAAPAPDLVVDTPMVSESAPAAGARFTLSATLRNQGNGPSGFTTLRYYQSTDSTITTSDTEVGTDSVSRLNASESGDESISLDAPDAPGTYYYGACVDAVSDESDTTNNCSVAVTVSVGAAPAPDLVVDTPTVSESAPAAGASFTLNVTVRNQGSGPSASNTLRYYQSSDPTITTGDTEVGRESVFGLAASASGDESINLDAPSTPGTYYYGACVDSVSDSSDTENNCSNAVAVTVGAQQTSICATGGVVPDAANNAGLVSDCETLLTAKDTLRGTGSLNWSPDTSITVWNGVVVSGTPPRVTSLSLASSDLTGQIPAELGGLTKLTELSLYLNELSGGIPAELGNLTDLTVLRINNNKLIGPIPAELGNLTNLTTLWLSVNRLGGGMPTALGNLTKLTTLRLNFNQLSGEIPTELGNLRRLSTLWLSDNRLNGSIPGQLGSLSNLSELLLYNNRLKGEIPLGLGNLTNLRQLRLANNQLTGCIPAGLRDVRENDLTQLGLPDCSLRTAPDLAVDAPTVSESAPAAEARFTLNATVRNQGNGASVSTTLRYYQSTDSMITTDDTVVGTDSVSGLNPSGVSAVSISLTAPATPGTYHYGACVDSVSNESDTTNNCSLSVAVTVGAAPSPDLAVDAPTVSESAPAAEARFTLSATVRNQGSGRSDSAMLRYYRSTDSTITTDDTVVGTDSVSSLDVSESGDASVTLTAPSTPGTYHYGACVDSVSNESDTTNNCSPAVTVTVGASVSVPSSATGLTATANDQTQIDLSWTAPSNDGGAAITGYKIEVSANGSSWSDLVANTGSTTTSYSHTGLTAGSTRYYRVSAINSAGTGQESNITDATTDTQQEASTCVANNPGLVSDCDTLLEVKDTLRGTGTLNWSADTPIASWDGITVGGTPQRVTELSLQNQGMTGTVPAALGELSGLETLNLGDNKHLSGPIPATLGNLTNLQNLFLYNNKLSGNVPTELGRLAKLQYLSLGNNQLTGAIPSQFGNLTNLRYLYVHNNKLTGAIPAELGGMTELSALGLSGNVLTGEIPAELGRMTRLVSLFLGDNQFTGTIPSELGRLSNLTDLNVRNNRLTGTIPDLSGTYMQFLRLEGNKMTGIIPVELSNLTSLQELRLNDNQLTGEIPSELGSLANLRRLYLSNNQLSGCIPAALRDVAENDLSDLSLPTCGGLAAPGSPTGLTATADGQTEIDLSWTAPSDDGGAAITGYKIEVSTDGSSWSDLVANTDSTSTSYTHTELTAGSTRRYRVSAINSAGTSQPSSTDSATTDSTPAATAPDAPTGLSATADGQTEIDLSWSAPSDDGGTDITGYKIEVSTNGSSWSDLVANTGSTGTSYSHTGLTEASTRHYRVSAINSAGTSQPSSTDSATTDSPPAATAPGAPTGLSATADGQTKIDLSWSAPSDDGGADITGYKIEVSTNDSSWSDLEADTDSTSTSYTHTGLTASTTRYYRVSAINSSGTGPASNTDSATTEAAPATQPGAPTGLTATANGQTQIDLSWTGPSDDGGAAITGYKIEVSTDGSSWSDLVANTGSTATSYPHTGLTASTTRYYRVSAINSVGTGPASNTDSATTAAEPVSDASCTVDLIVRPEESCTYPGTSTEFSVDSNGTGRFLFASSGSRIELRNTTINGVTYTFVASKQSDGNWLVEEVG